MKHLVLTLIIQFSIQAASYEDWTLKEFSVEKSKTNVFIKHENETPYLSMNLQIDPFKGLLEKMNRYSYKILKNRGEAHITVITPIEYKDDLAKYINIQEIDQIAEKLKIQDSSYKPICLGRGTLSEKDKYLETYYMVIESSDLIQLRKEIASLYQKRGGQKFDPLHFYPHITIGFTDRDLHESDGVLKDSKSCVNELTFKDKK